MGQGNGYGVESIRLGGLRIEELPFAAAAVTRGQLPLVLDNDRQNKVKDVLRRYPPQTVVYLQARMKECRENIVRVSKVSGEQNQMISDYIGHIKMCEFRDAEMAKTEDPAALKALRLKYPPYSVPAMEQQIKQCHESIARCEGVVATEHGSIEELTALISQCEVRDKELKSLNAKLH